MKEIKAARLVVEMHRQVMIENIATVTVTALAIAGVAIGTGSLHCFWGLLILINLTTYTPSSK